MNASNMLDYTAQPDRLRIVAFLRAMTPQWIGLGLSALAWALLYTPTGPVLDLAASQHPVFMGVVIWILPVLSGTIVTAVSIVGVDIMPGRVGLRRGLGTVRWYDQERITWGFGNTPEMYTMIPPTDSRQTVRFTLHTSDDRKFTKGVSGRTAQQIAALLADRQVGSVGARNLSRAA